MDIKQIESNAARDIMRAKREAKESVNCFKSKLWRKLEPNFYEVKDKEIDRDKLTINEQILMGRLQCVFDILKSQGIAK